MACIDVRGATLTVPQGNDKTWAITATNPDGTSKDMTSYTLVFTVGDAPTYDIQKTATLDTPLAPVKGHLVLTASDLNIPVGTYRYDYALWKDGLKQSSYVGDFIVSQVVNVDSTP